MSIPRFYCPELKEHGPWALPEQEAQHAVRVLRMNAGDELQAFDGRGFLAKAKIQAVGKREVICESIEYRFEPLELPGYIQMAVAMPKGDRQRLVIEKLVELGVHELIPLESTRTVAEATPNAMLRWERYSIEASKQCGRNRLLKIGAKKDFGALMEDSDTGTKVGWIAHPYLSSDLPCRQQRLELQVSSVLDGRMMVLIGPEGGFSQSELELAVDQGWKIVQVPGRILRVESAVAYFASILGAILEPPNAQSKILSGEDALRG